MLTIMADFLGAIGSGTGILLAAARQISRYGGDGKAALRATGEHAEDINKHSSDTDWGGIFQANLRGC